MKFGFAFPACAWGLASASAVDAEWISPADFLDEIPGFVREGRLAGMDVWRNEIADEYWFIAPDGKSVVAGRVVGSVGSSVQTRKTKEISSIFSKRDGSGRDARDIGEINAGSGNIGQNAEFLQSSLCEGALLPRSTPSCKGSCNNFSAAGQAAFNSGELSKIRAALDLPKTGGKMPKRTELLDELRRKAFWFGIGNPDSPPIYAIVDPVCPYSAEAMLRLEDSVESGALQLRIILVPTARHNSAETLSSILVHPDPPTAFWEHAIAMARRGNSDLQLGDYANLPAGIRAAVRANSELALELEIPGVPFFAFRSSNGDSIYAGVPARDQFANALPE